MVTQPLQVQAAPKHGAHLLEQLTQNSRLNLLTHLREISLINVLNLKHRLRP